jgi:type VI secretion system secreted protein Hcp
MSTADIFLKIDGICGECLDDKHKDSFEVLSYSLGVSNLGTASIGSGLGSGKANFHDVNFVIESSVAIPTLFQQCANGTHFKKMVLTERKTGGEGGPLEWLVYEFEDSVISNVNLGRSGGQNGTVNLSVNFSKFKATTQKQDQKGGKGPQIVAGWDVKQNVKV